MQGVPSKELVSELDFDFPIETLGTNLTYENILFFHNEIIQQMASSFTVLFINSLFRRKCFSFLETWA